MQLQRLSGKDCLELRPLWEEVFWEDSREFTDYYFANKADKNQGYALWEKKYLSMLYLTNYEMQVRSGENFLIVTAPYIVGVATKEQERHKGYMRTLLENAMQDMYQSKIPFCFLMPANPKIYEPFGFHYIYDRKIYRLHQPVSDYEKMTVTDIPRIKDYVNQKLKRQFDVFTKRDRAYYQLLVNELAAQNGGIYFAGQRNKERNITGYFWYAKEEEQEEIGELLQDEETVAAVTTMKPQIMARIINIEEMLSFICSAKEKLELKIAVQDEQIAANKGIYEWVLTPTGSIAAKNNSSCKVAQADCSVTIADLTAFLFGYKSAGQCFQISNENKEKVLCKLNSIKVLSKVFLNEIV